MKPKFRVVLRCRRPLPRAAKRPHEAWLAPQSLDRPFFLALHDLLDRDGEITLGQIVDEAGEQTCGLLVLLLAMPSLVPGLNLGAAPLGGAAIMAMGIQMLLGKSRPWVPERVRRQPIHKGRMKNALAKLEAKLERLGRRIGPRRTLSRPWMGFVIAWTGFLLFLPVPLPFANLWPASTLVLLGAALLEERPSWGWLGTLGSLANTAYFALSYDLLAHQGVRMIHSLRQGLT